MVKKSDELCKGFVLVLLFAVGWLAGDLVNDVTGCNRCDAVSKYAINQRAKQRVAKPNRDNYVPREERARSRERR